MTTKEIKALVTSAAPEAQRYVSAFEGESFTVWGEYQRLPMSADNGYIGGWRFGVQHYTRVEDDLTAEAIESALEADDRVSFTYEVAYDNRHGYIVHVFDCEGY